MVERINDDSSQPEIIKGSWYVEKKHFIGTGGSRWLLVVQSIQLYKVSLKKERLLHETGPGSINPTSKFGINTKMDNVMYSFRKTNYSYYFQQLC